MVGLPYSRVDGQRPWRAESSCRRRERVEAAPWSRSRTFRSPAAATSQRKAPHQPGTIPLGSAAVADQQSSQRSRGLTAAGVSLCVFQPFKRGFLNHWERRTPGEQPRSPSPGFQHPSQHESYRFQAVPSQHEALSGRSGPNIATQWRHWMGGCVAGAGSRVPPRTKKPE